MHFSPFFSDKAVKIKPESFFWWKIVLICHIACPKWIKIVDFRGFLHFRAENPGFRVKILKLQFLQKGSMKNFKNCTKQTPTLYIFMGGMSCLCSWKKLISPQKPTVMVIIKYNKLFMGWIWISLLVRRISLCFLCTVNNWIDTYAFNNNESWAYLLVYIHVEN